MPKISIKPTYIEIINDKSYKIKPIFDNKKCFNLVFAFNDNYSKYFAVALQSLIENSKPKQLYDIVIFTSDLSDRNAKRLLNSVPNNFTIRFFNIKNYILDNFENIKFSVTSNWSEEMYYRLFIPIIMNKYKKVLYLDSDIIFNGNIGELFNIDFEDKELIAISDDVKLVLKNKDLQKRIKYIKQDLKVKNPKAYFNSGVLLFNISKIDLNDYLQRLLSALKLETVYFPDQDMLNLIFNNRSKLINWEWNLQYHIPIFYAKNLQNIDKKDYEEYIKAYEKPIIVHYTSTIKPWIDPTQELSELFWFYARHNIYYEEILAAMGNYSIIDSAKAIDLYIKLYGSKKILLWGASLFLEQFIMQYDIKTNNLLGIIDKNSEKQGKFIKQYKVYSPDDIEHLQPDEIIITILHYVDEREKEIKSFIKNKKLKNIKVTRLV